MSLPIHALRAAFDAALAAGPVVVSAPTGSGKSTEIPRWCLGRGRVLVVEPRRVACRSLAERVAELEGAALGGLVGYRVRDDDRSSAATRLLFATPGVVLRMLAADALAGWDTVVLDELHERTLDVDLLLALCRARVRGRLVAMSATLDDEAVAAFLGGVALRGEGRTFPVEHRYLSDDARLPDAGDLPARVAAALDRAAHPGDVLVFLPGKAEILRVEQSLRRADLSIVPLHGGLSLDEQRAAFRPTPHRKVVLATNVAETSITLPGIGVVIDAGLVRRTRYHDGRGYLTLLPVAADQADQRAGRAGRTGPGLCLRLWGARARLDARTPPEVHRESLVPLVLASAACGARVDDLPFLDAPRAYALDAARDELAALGALAGDALTERGRALFQLPLDPGHGRLLVEAEGTPVLADMVDLVAALTVDRPLFAAGPPPADPADDLREQGCDVVAAIRAVREGEPARHGLRAFTLHEARQNARRLRRMFGLPERPTPAPVDRRALALVAMAADHRVAHVARHRKRAVAWSNGGTELALGRDSALAPVLETPAGAKIEAALILHSRALGRDARQTEIVATCAMPVPLAWLLAGGVGRERVGPLRRERDALVAEVEVVHAGRVLGTREAVPTGALAREALARFFLEGRLWREARAMAEERLDAWALHRQLEPGGPALPPLADWVLARLEALGFESGADLALLSPDDLLPDDLPADVRERLDRLYPRRLDIADGVYRVVYDVARRDVLLDKIGGQRKEPPRLAWLPAFAGFRVRVRHKNQEWTLRERR
ncbi:MAG: ATP-dependent RNA helicase [Myxococcales bacterium]|nr:ATP-dependent RNA helicase [Myxococcales bacterium]